MRSLRPLIIGSLSDNVFERRTSTGSDLFSFFDGGFAQIFSQIASIVVKKLRNTNFISSRHVKRENTSLPVDVRRSKTSLLKLPNFIRRVNLFINNIQATCKTEKIFSLLIVFFYNIHLGNLHIKRFFALFFKKIRHAFAINHFIEHEKFVAKLTS